MKVDEEVSSKQVNNLYNVLNKQAESSGYHLNPDVDFTKELVKSLLINEKRYGYWACPCRLASGNKTDDLDIICPCDYRDADLSQYNCCYCSLYVTQSVVEGKKQIEPIPERRPQLKQRHQNKKIKTKKPELQSLSKPVWRCKVCGYLCCAEVRH